MSRHKKIMYAIVSLLALVLFIVTCAKVSFEDPFTGPDEENVPVILLLGPDPYYLNVNEVYEEPGCNAYDTAANPDNDLHDLVKIKDNNFSTASVGVHIVKYYVTNTKNVTGFAKRTVIVKQAQVGDTVKPVITLIGLNPRRMYVGNTFVDDGATAWDNVDGDITGSMKIYGNTITTAVPDTCVIWYMVMDRAGNVGCAKRSVYVLDGSDVDPPVITLKGNNPDSIIIHQSYVEMGATAYDQVDGDLSSQIQIVNKVDTATIGIWQVNYSVKDKANNVGEATRYVKVKPMPDNVPPVITLLGANPFTMAVNENFQDPGHTAYDDIDGDITNKVDVNDDMLDKSKLGSYQVKYNVKDAAGNPAEEKIRTVNVVDTIGPVITIKGPKTVNLATGFPYTEYGATALDNYDGNVTSKIDTTGDSVNTAVADTYYVHYVVSDNSGNKSDSVRIVMVGDMPDNTPPVITVKGSNPISLIVGGTYVEYGATAMDNKDGDITNKIDTNADTVNTNLAGTYRVHYNVSDNAGNKDHKVRTVYVGVTAKDTVLIGNGNTTGQSLPIEPYYKYTYSQCIYTKAELMVSKTITIDSIAYYYIGTAWTDNIVVYMGNTSKSSFASTSDWITLTNLTQVYSGTYSVTTTAGWRKIKLSSPFPYNNAANLVIAVDENTSSYHQMDNFRCTSKTAYRSLVYYGDTVNPNPSSPPTAAVSGDFLQSKIYSPNIIIYYH